MKPKVSAATIRPISTIAAFLRPMYCARMPSGKRISAPARIGTEIMKPFSAALRLKLSLMKGAIAPFRTQIAKQKSKYRKEAARVGQWPALAKDLKSDIGVEGAGWDGSVAEAAAGGLCATGSVRGALAAPCDPSADRGRLAAPADRSSATVPATKHLPCRHLDGACLAWCVLGVPSQERRMTLLPPGSRSRLSRHAEDPCRGSGPA